MFKKMISHLNSSSNLIHFKKISKKYLISLWIRPLFTIIPFNSIHFYQIGKLRNIFDTRPCEINDLTVSSHHFTNLDNQLFKTIFFKEKYSYSHCPKIDGQISHHQTKEVGFLGFCIQIGSPTGDDINVGKIVNDIKF